MWIKPPGTCLFNPQFGLLFLQMSIFLVTPHLLPLRKMFIELPILVQVCRSLPKPKLSLVFAAETPPLVIPLLVAGRAEFPRRAGHVDKFPVVAAPTPSFRVATMGCLQDSMFLDSFLVQKNKSVVFLPWPKMDSFLV